MFDYILGINDIFVGYRGDGVYHAQVFDLRQLNSSVDRIYSKCDLRALMGSKLRNDYKYKLLNR